jgi:tripartite-type tricarboxylate transporter receptor subunit TctC
MKSWYLRAAAAALVALASSALAQQFPTKPIAMMVPFPQGPTDTVARIVAQSMAKSLGQSILVENRPSVGGLLAPELVKNAKPDGYTILIHHIGMATTPALYSYLRFNPLTDFDYIGLINEVPMTLIGNDKLPAKDFKELLVYIKLHKDTMAYAHAGIGAASHLCGMLFQSAIETELLAVPYKGTGPAMNDLMGGQVQLLCDQTTNTTSAIKSGKVKAYGVTTLKRVESLKEVATLDEQGLKGFEISIWQALYAPKGTPKEVIDKLSGALQGALKDSLVIQRFRDLGATAYPPEKATPAALEAHLKAEIQKWAPIIKKNGAYIDRAYAD